MTLSNIQSNASRGLLGNTTFIPAGAVKPSLAASTGANQCSFGSLYRTAKRGGPFIAQPADIPTASVYVSPGYLFVMTWRIVMISYTLFQHGLGACNDSRCLPPRPIKMTYKNINILQVLQPMLGT